MWGEWTHTQKAPRINCNRASAIARLTRAENDNLCRPHKLIRWQWGLQTRLPRSSHVEGRRFSLTQLIYWNEILRRGTEEITVKCRATIRNSCQVLINVSGGVREQLWDRLDKKSSNPLRASSFSSEKFFQSQSTDPRRLLSTNVTDVGRGKISHVDEMLALHMYNN